MEKRERNISLFAPFILIKGYSPKVKSLRRQPRLISEDKTQMLWQNKRTINVKVYKRGVYKKKTKKKKTNKPGMNFVLNGANRINCFDARCTTGRNAKFTNENGTILLLTPTSASVPCP